LFWGVGVVREGAQEGVLDEDGGQRANLNFEHFEQNRKILFILKFKDVRRSSE
jgi:hypothetical protein